MESRPISRLQFITHDFIFYWETF